jgi:hypothetical protein
MTTCFVLFFGDAERRLPQSLRNLSARPQRGHQRRHHRQPYADGSTEHYIRTAGLDDPDVLTISEARQLARVLGITPSTSSWARPPTLWRPLSTRLRKLVRAIGKLTVAAPAGNTL